MTEPTKPLCPLCGGHEVLYLNDHDVETCRCLKARLIRQHLGTEIASADTITNSPLLSVQDDVVQHDRTTENLLIKARWYDVLSHLKWVLYCKGTRYRFRITTDEKVRTVWVGNERYVSKSKATRDDGVSYNSLADLVGADLELVILRLGKLGYKNVAAPGVLKEALMLREVACLPTWLIEEPETPWGYGCHTFSDDVGDYIDRRFKIVSLVSKARSTPIQHVEMPEDCSAAEEPAEQYTRPSPSVQSRFPSSNQPNPDMMSVVSAPDRYKKKSWGKKPSGGGPV